MDYQSVLEDRLASEQGPDLFYVRPFALGQQLIESGFVQLLDTEQFVLNEQYPPEILELWMMVFPRDTPSCK